MVKPLIAPKKKKCALCGDGFIPYRPHQIYCCKAHQLEDYNKKNDIPGLLRKMRAQRKKKVL